MAFTRIFAIETSCDETAIALVRGTGDRLSVEKSVVLSQIEEHAQYGGVVPEVAARKHMQALMPMLEAEIERDGNGIDAIAVTQGPGLAPALRSGVEVAKTLAWLWKKPFVPVSHLEGHIYAAWLPEGNAPTQPRQGTLPAFPALCLLVSGGHTELVLMRDHGVYERVGETLDDAAGEAFDKTAKMLGLPYPGGPEIARLAQEGERDAFDFPRGLLNRQNCDFSFSGLKTSVLYKLRDLVDEKGVRAVADLEPQTRANIAASIEEAIVDVLVRKTLRAAERFAPQSLVLAGGVAANKTLRQRLNAKAATFGVPLYVPPFAYSTDNAAMIAAAGYFRAKSEKHYKNPLLISAQPNMEIV